MSFAHLFWSLSAVGAVLFFAAGLSASALRRALAPAGAGALDVDGPPRARDAWASERATLVNERDERARECAELRARLARAEVQAAASREEKRAWATERAALLAERDALEQRANDTHAQYTLLKASARQAQMRASVELDKLRERLDGIEKARRDDPASLPVFVPTSAAGSTFQALLDRITPIPGMRSAVLGDALGLPIASFGDHPESLAGFCGFLSQAATRASDFLPLGPIRRIVLEDDRQATLTACSVPGSEIFLATLTAGPGPELPRMVQILNDASSFLVERNQA